MELHPFNANKPIVDFCHEHGIVLEAWAPLVRGWRFEHPVITSLAAKYAVTPAQILIRYSLQKGYVVLPKSVSQARIQANTQVFGWQIDAIDMELLDGLDEGLVTDWNPTEEP
jgi:diketogulonate reductase-like aldo/keto reductase